jgi:hypothetical protein
MSTEITGLAPSIAYAQHLAEVAGQHAPEGNESYLQHLTAARVTGDGLSTAQQMQQAFAAAAAAAQAHATELGKQLGVQEAYDQNPDAGDKAYQLGGAGSSQAGAQQPQQNTAPPAPSAPAVAAQPAPGALFGAGDPRQASWAADHPGAESGVLTIANGGERADVRVSQAELDDLLTQLRWLDDYGSCSENRIDCTSGTMISWSDFEEAEDGSAQVSLYVDNGFDGAGLTLKPQDLGPLRNRLRRQLIEAERGGSR